MVHQPTVTGKLVTRLAIERLGVGKMPENMYLNQVPHNRYIRRILRYRYRRRQTSRLGARNRYSNDSNDNDQTKTPFRSHASRANFPK
jgi:hypothetical protein